MSCTGIPPLLAVAVVSMPHEKWGETPCAFIELKVPPTRNVSPADPKAEQALAGGHSCAHCREQSLAGFKLPRAFTFGELPKTSTGKLQKFALRGRAGSAKAIDV